MSTRLQVLVAGGLVATVLLSLVAIAALAAADAPVPGVLEDAVKVGLGAIAALLARVGGPEDVRVVNAADEAVPVEDAGHMDVSTAGLLALVIAAGVVLGALLLQWID